MKASGVQNEPKKLADDDDDDVGWARKDEAASFPSREPTGSIIKPLGTRCENSIKSYLINIVVEASKQTELVKHPAWQVSRV